MARVLLVDDDIAEISAVKRVLARAGHHTVLATNAADGLAAVARGRPDLLLVGAGCEGGDALRRFGDEDVRGIPLVVLGESDAAPHGTAQVPRPVDPGRLAELLSRALAGDASAEAPAGAAAPDPDPQPQPRVDGATARKAAAEALRARAEELRRGAPVAAPGAPAPPLAAAPDLAPPLTPAPDPDPASSPATAPPSEPEPAAPGPELEGSGLEAILRRAEEAERAHAAERKARARQADRAAVEAAQRAEAERVAVEKAARARAAEERARAERRARAEAERKAQEEAAARARAEETARAHADEDRRATEAEARAHLEAQARARLEDELERLRVQVEEERKSAEERVHSVLERAAAEERASEDLRRLAEEEAQRRLAEEARRREAEEEDLRRAIASARAEMEALRRKGEDEARRRAEAEAEVARLGREAERRAADAAALPRPLELPSPPPPHEEPAPDPAEEAARRRVATLKGRGAPAGEPATAAAETPRAVRPPPPELRAGALADLPAPRLLALAARAEATGRLDFEGDGARSLWLEDGRVVGAASADPAERVEEIALRLGLVTRDQHRQVTGAAAALPSRRAALLLLERGYLKPTELTALVRRRIEEVVFGVFADDAARFRWAAAEVPPDERTALDRSTLALAVEGVRRRWLAPRVDAVLGGPGTLVAPLETGPALADLALSAGERRAVALADGLRTVDEIVAGSPLDPLSTRQVLAALVLVGALAVRVFQGGRPAAAATAAIDLARVREKLEQARRSDYFTILGVGRRCTPHEVREAAERLAAEFDPRRFEAVREDGLEGRLVEIRRVVADAREILVDDRLREEYLRGLGD